MADEKRSLIYELLVEAKGADKVEGELTKVNKGFAELAGVAKGAGVILAAAFALKGIQQALDELTQFRAVMGTLGLTATETSAALQNVQATALVTGKSIAEVSKVYGEAIQLNDALGRSHEDAARSADAFTRVAVAEGKSASAAAAQINTLSFALEKGAIGAKEFANMLKDSPTFAKAAQEALGMTTQQLIELAKEGELTNAQLTKIILHMEELGEQTNAAVTLGGITEALKTISTSFIQAIADAAGFNATLGGTAVTGLQMFLDIVTGIGQAIGGTIRLVANFIQELISVARVFAQIIADPLDWANVMERWSADLGQDIEDQKAALEDIGKGLTKAVGQNPEYDPANIAKKKAEEKARDDQAVAKQEMRDRVALYKKYQEDVAAYEKAQEEKRARDAKAAADKRERDAAKLAEEMAKHREDMKDKAAKDYADIAKVADKELTAYLKDFGKDGIDAMLKEMNEAAPQLTLPLLEQFDQIEQAAAVLEDSFAQLFSGGIANAREFFSMVLTGLANIFAQLAAAQATEEIRGWLNALFPGKSGFTPTHGTSELDLSKALGGPYAKGAAFERGQVIPFAGGGVVSGPSTFGMAGGATGLMGEAGPEAVMPLRRTAGGKLGVAGTTPNITIVNQLGVPAAARMKQSADRMTLILEAAQMGANLAESRVNRSLRTGYGSTAQSIQGTYGLRRRT